MDSKAARPVVFKIGLIIGLLNIAVAVFVMVITIVDPTEVSPSLLIFANAIAIHFTPIIFPNNWPATFDLLFLFIMLINLIGGGVSKNNRYAGGVMMIISALTLLIFCIVSITDPLNGNNIRLYNLTTYSVVIIIVEALSLLAGVLALAIRQPNPIAYGTADKYYPGANQPYSQQPISYNHYGQPCQNQQPVQKIKRFDPYTGQPLGGTSAESETPNK